MPANVQTGYLGVPEVPASAESYGPVNGSFVGFASPVLQDRWEAAKSARQGYDPVASDLAQFGFDVNQLGNAAQVFGAFHLDAGDHGRRQEAYNTIVRLVEDGRVTNAPGMYGPVLPPEMVADAVAKRFGYEANEKQSAIDRMGQAANAMQMMQQLLFNSWFYRDNADDEKESGSTAKKSGAKSKAKTTKTAPPTASLRLFF